MEDIFKNLSGCQMNMKGVCSHLSKAIRVILMIIHSIQVKTKDF
jgi:hypothetical protein